MLCSVYTSIAGEYCDPGFCTPIGKYLNTDRNYTWYYNLLNKTDETLPKTGGF